MQFIESSLLWGTLAIAIPIAIHFWHQKQGKLLPWAATQWLTESRQQQSRGLRLDNVVLLILRCLLLILLALLLAQPIINWFSKTPAVAKVHLVQPTSVITDNFRFELTEAKKNGERVAWLSEKPESVDDQLTLPDKSEKLNPIRLQTAINTLDPKNTELHLYVANDPMLLRIPSVTVPKRFQLHSIIDSSRQIQNYLNVKDNKKLFVNRFGKLTNNPTLDPTVRFQSEPSFSGTITTLLTYQNPKERQTVKAALSALADVYGLDVTFDEQPVSNRHYQLILTDKLPTQPNPKTRYVVSGIAQTSAADNIIYTNETLTPQTSELVATGQLPEWLGKQLLNSYKLEPNPQYVSQQALNALFVPTTKTDKQQQAGLQNGLLLAFVTLLLVERWLALTRNA